MKSKQEGALNLLKFIATAIIVLHHFQQLSGVFFEGELNFCRGKFNWGYMVELFFILSGYFTYKYSKTLNLEEGFFSFFRKKYCRFFSLLVITGIGAIFVNYWVNITTNTGFNYDTLWNCLGGIFGFGRWFTTGIIANNPTWYINVLLLCYAVFYFCTFWAKRKNVSTSSVYLVAMLFGLLMHHISTIYKFSMPFFSEPIGRGLLCFFLGLLLREIFERFQLHKKAVWVALSALYVIGFIFVYVEKYAFVSINLYYLLCFTVFPCVILLFKTAPLQKLCSAKLFSKLSSITYHTYMWHLIVIQLTLNICRLNNIAFDTKSVMYICLALAFLVGTASFCVTNVISAYRQKRIASHG